MRNAAVTLVLLLNCLSAVYSQDTPDNPVRVLFYNVENLFDTYNDTAKNDEEFLPSGTRRWNRTRYDRKINSLYKTILAAGNWSPPAIVGLCEVENRKVLEDLAYATYLSKYDYSIIHEDSPDERGIDVCLIYREDLVSVIGHKYLIPSSVKGGGFRTRSVLYTKFLVMGDTLHLMVNHWPSRRGGVLAGESLRCEIAAMIRHVTDSIGIISCGKARILIMGDFNCTPEDNIMQNLVNHSSDDSQEKSIFLINLAGRSANPVQGTYKFNGTWEIIDQMVASRYLLECCKGTAADSLGFKIFSPDFLLCNDEKHTGSAPFSTYRGYRYQGGVSDHLPIFLDLVLR